MDSLTLLADLDKGTAHVALRWASTYGDTVDTAIVQEALIERTRTK